MGGGWRSVSPDRAADVLESQDAQHDGCRKQPVDKVARGQMYANGQEIRVPPNSFYHYLTTAPPLAIAVSTFSILPDGCAPPPGVKPVVI